jgi:cellulose biosynthesis protein BcsQ
MIFALISSKGGVGKSSIGMNLARYLSRKKGNRVALIDGDRTRSITNWYNRGSGHGFDLVTIEGGIGPDDYDYWVVDTPGDPDAESLNDLIEAADRLIIPSGCGILDLEGALDTFDRLGNAQNKAVAILSMIDPRATTRAMASRAALINAGLPCIDKWLYKRTAYQDAALAGLTVDRLKGGSARQSWADCLAVFGELLGRNG